MSDVDGEAGGRLDNLQNIEPMLTSLRVLSLSTMQMAMNRKTYLNAYRQNYFKILAYLQHAARRKLPGTENAGADRKGKAILVVLGSDRGMCGTYNKTLAALAAAWLEKQTGTSSVLSFGTRLHTALRQNDVPHEDAGSISSGSLPDYRGAHELVDGWLQGYADETIRTVEVLAFRKPRKGGFKPKTEHLIPQEIENPDDAGMIEWPEPIIEGDPVLMIAFARDHLTSLLFQEIILESIEAENTIRYNLLEEAKDNIEELIESLTLVVQAERRQAITEQLQELAASAALSE